MSDQNPIGGADNTRPNNDGVPAESPCPPLTIRKRDGSVEPFSRPKLVACLRRSLHEVSDPDPPATAEALAESVVHYLEEARIEASIPGHRLREFTETVLSQSGYALAADVMKHHARVREHQRRQVHVACFHDRRKTFVHRRWSKSAVVATLRTTYELELAVARWVGGIVETAVLRSGLKVVTTGLIKEMITSELLAWGLLPSVLRTTSRGRPTNAEPRTTRGAQGRS